MVIYLTVKTTDVGSVPPLTSKSQCPQNMSSLYPSVCFAIYIIEIQYETKQNIKNQLKRIEFSFNSLFAEFQACQLN